MSAATGRSNSTGASGAGGPDRPPPLEVRGLTLRFGGVEALAGVDLRLEEGELLALVGPNGAGKTALLNCITGIYRPQAGRITLFGQEVTGLKPWQVARLGVGRSFQHAEVFPSLTVVENLLLGLQASRRPGFLAYALHWGPGRRQEVRDREAVEEVVEFFELERYRKQRAGNLPYGLQKLVGVARAVCGRPRVLLLDEPASGLNREEKENLARFILRLQAEWRLPILWVEHDLQMVVDLADRIAVLDYGVKIADGPPAEVVRSPAVIDAFVGTGNFSLPVGGE